MSGGKITGYDEGNGVTRYTDSSGKVVGYTQKDAAGVIHHLDSNFNDTGTKTYTDDSGLMRTVDGWAVNEYSGYKDSNGLVIQTDHMGREVGAFLDYGDGTVNVYSSSPEDIQQARVDAYVHTTYEDLVNRNTPPKRTISGKRYSDDELRPFYPQVKYEISQAEAYLRYAGTLLLRKHRGSITTDTLTAERQDKHTYGPFNLLSRITNTKVDVPRLEYWELNHEFTERTSLDEFIREEDHTLDTGITPEGKLIFVSYDETFYTQKGYYKYHDYSVRTPSDISEISLHNSADWEIALVDNYLAALKEDMSFSKYLSDPSSYREDPQLIADYQTDLRNRAKELTDPRKIADGKLNNWHWWAIIPLIPCLLTVTDMVRILFALMFLVWLFVYPISHFRYEKINPKADNINYEIIILSASALLEVFFMFRGFRYGGIGGNIYNLFFGGLYVCCLLASIYDKRHLNNKSDGPTIRAGQEEEDPDEDATPFRRFIGRFNKWQWLALIPLMALTATIPDIIKICLGLFYLVWLVVYPFNHFKYKNINPKAGNLFYEIAMIAAVTSIMILSYVKDVRMFFYHPLLAGCFVLLMVMSILEKLSKRNKT